MTTMNLVRQESSKSLMRVVADAYGLVLGAKLRRHVILAFNQHYTPRRDC